MNENKTAYVFDTSAWLKYNKVIRRQCPLNHEQEAITLYRARERRL
ncbi:MAG: hypothetical protein ISS41_10990 [Candidatus Aminicenantes bacterium]|nr:hypothetical protein [Candidatus Aminicenantes bacterium]